MTKQMAIVFSKSLFDSTNFDFERKSDLSLSNSLLEDSHVTLYFSIEALDNIINYQTTEGLAFVQKLPSWQNFIRDRLAVVPSEYYSQKLLEELGTQNLVLHAVAMEGLAKVVVYYPNNLSQEQDSIVRMVKQELANTSGIFLFESVEVLACDSIDSLITFTAIKF